MDHQPRAEKGFGEMSGAAAIHTVVTILGSGSCVPRLERSSCAILVSAETEAGEQENLLFDCGAGTTRRLLEAGRRPDTISHIFLSHFHPDHASELVYFLFSLCYADPKRTPPTVTIVGGQGLYRFVDGLAQSFGNWLVRSDSPFDFAEVTPGDGMQATRCFQVNWGAVDHKPESLAYRAGIAGGRSLVYSGDTAYSPSLVRLARDADLLVCEASFPDDQAPRGHMTPSLAGKTARLAGVGRLVLTHLNPGCDPLDFAERCRQEYEGEVVIASDLMRLDL